MILEGFGSSSCFLWRICGEDSHFCSQFVSAMERAMIRFLLLLLVTTQLTSDADPITNSLQGKHLIVVLENASFLISSYFHVNFNFVFIDAVSSIDGDWKRWIRPRNWLLGFVGGPFRLAFKTIGIRVNYIHFLSHLEIVRDSFKLKKVHDDTVG